MQGSHRLPEMTGSLDANKNGNNACKGSHFSFLAEKNFPKTKKNLIFRDSFKNNFVGSEKCSNFARCLEQTPRIIIKN